MPYVSKSKRKPYKAGRRPSTSDGKGKATAIPLPTPSGLYLPNEEQLVRMLAARGAGDEEIEDLAMIPRGTLGRWREVYPGLDKAIEEGRTRPDANVLFAAYRNAVGYEYVEEQAVGGRDPTVLTVKRIRHGSHEAQKYWLNNRQKQNWRQASSSEVSGPNGGPIGVKHETRNQLIDAILSLVVGKPDDEVKQGKPKEDRR